MKIVDICWWLEKNKCPKSTFCKFSVPLEWWCAVWPWQKETRRHLQQEKDALILGNPSYNPGLLRSVKQESWFDFFVCSSFPQSCNLLTWWNEMVHLMDEQRAINQLIRPWKPTWHGKIPMFNRKYIFKCWIFHCHVRDFGVVHDSCPHFLQPGRSLKIHCRRISPSKLNSLLIQGKLPWFVDSS